MTDITGLNIEDDEEMIAELEAKLSLAEEQLLKANAECQLLTNVVIEHARDITEAREYALDGVAACGMLSYLIESIKDRNAEDVEFAINASTEHLVQMKKTIPEFVTSHCESLIKEYDLTNAIGSNSIN